ncbi:CTL-like protein DDB_G0274487 isoform X2 [Phoenix dactylifera]|uniref:Choline transporter-like protein n=1 Tax=Phoenix dactylifera TaxID=42345 RepID=A0A8B8J1X1_PHODC|nr:CTL-like protein DDB_G0274487 isoform X2 [Phoenix dactylifera]
MKTPDSVIEGGAAEEEMGVMEEKGGDRKIEEGQEMDAVKAVEGEKKEVEVVVEASQSLAQSQPPAERSVTRLQAQHPVTPIQVVPHGASPPTAGGAAAAAFQQTRAPPQVALASLNSRAYTNRISLALFVLHLVVVAAAVCFFVFKAVQGVVDVGSDTARKEKRGLKFWLPPIECSAVLSMILAFAWQKAVRLWPGVMVHFVLWSTFGFTMSAGILLLCFSLPSTAGMGVALIGFSIGTGLYACWVTRRIGFTARVFHLALLPAAKFRHLNGPTYLMLAAGFLWISLWCLAVIGALNFYYPPLTIIALVVSLAWTAEVMRNVANLTVSRVIALYYLRGMQSDINFSFQRAISINLGSASLGSFFVPSIEALRIIARGLNLLEGEDEFLFSCAHCCLHVMESIFRNGNSWAFVHIAAYGKGFVEASRSTWGLFERQRMEELADSDITSAICFLSGVCSGAICVIFAASWTFSSYRKYTATVSLLVFFVGYLMTRIGMALPHACVACYYVCYAENPGSRLFDSTIPDRLKMIETGREAVVSTPRFPRRVPRT